MLVMLSSLYELILLVVSLCDLECELIKPVAQKVPGILYVCNFLIMIKRR